MKKKFENAAMNHKNLLWEQAVSRQEELYTRKNDIRSEFARDYTRILHARSYRRLKHKTQVFFNVHNDHICTRMEHVLHVESVSSNISDVLGLNTELVKAIATGHDLGHAPFGHPGEKIISGLTEKYLGEVFWHEKNGIRVVDRLDLIHNPQNVYQNLNLTYAVRDGIISHCGEVDDNALFPRKEMIDLYDIKTAGQYNAFTWEGCVVKLADKIAYLGRDIEDALMLKIITYHDLASLVKIAAEYGHDTINTSVIMHEFIVDLVKNSSPEKGICFSDEKVALMKEIKDFNIAHIYSHKKLEPFVKYTKLVIETLFDYFIQFYNGKSTLSDIKENSHDSVLADFYKWLIKYCFTEVVPNEDRVVCERYNNYKLYGALEEKTIYTRAVLDYISGMTDAYAIDSFQAIISF